MGWADALLVEKFFEFLAGTEKRKFFGFDIDLFPGFGIAAFVTLIFLDLETSESTDFDPIVLQEFFPDGIEKGVDHDDGLIHGDIILVCHCFDQFTLVHDIVLYMEGWWIAQADSTVLNISSIADN